MSRRTIALGFGVAVFAALAGQSSGSERPVMSVAAFEALVSSPDLDGTGGKAIAAAYLEGIRATIWWLCEVKVSVPEMRVMAEHYVEGAKDVYAGKNDYENFRQTTEFGEIVFLSLQGHFSGCQLAK